MRPLFLYSFGMLLLASCILQSCNLNRKKTLLDFEFGMTREEYNDHLIALAKSGTINTSKFRYFGYSLRLPDNNLVAFSVIPNFFSNGRLYQLEAQLRFNLNDSEKRQLYDLLAAKHGIPKQPFAKNEDNNLWYAIWDLGRSEVRLILGDYDKVIGAGEILYSAQGNLYNDIKSQDANAQTNVENEY